MAKKLPTPLTREDFDKLLEEAKRQRQYFWKPRSKRYTPRGQRINQYICSMVLAYGAGLRISEIVGYKTVPKLSPDKLENNMIRISQGKGQKDRVTLLPGKLFLKAGINRDQLRKMLPLKISRRALQNYVSKLGKKVLGRNIHFHQFRHGFGSELAGASRPLHEIQMMMGHSRLDTTGIYLHANPKQAIKGAEEVF